MAALVTSRQWRCARPVWHSKPITTIAVTRTRSQCLDHLTARSGVATDHAQTTLAGTDYADIVDKLARHALEAVSSLPAGRRRHVVGIAGAPGSGKSTLAAAVCRRVNELAHTAGIPPYVEASGSLSRSRSGSRSGSSLGSGDNLASTSSIGSAGLSTPPDMPLEDTMPADLAVVLPMDGFHYYKRQLDEMADPQEAHARRGAHWTFDGGAFVRCVRTAKHEPSVSVPSFDHGAGDPVPDDIQIRPHHRVLLVEGNYLLLDAAPWSELHMSVFDDTWFVDVPIDVAMARVEARQIACGRPAAAVAARVQSNDRLNGELVATTRHRAALLVPSVPLELCR